SGEGVQADTGVMTPAAGGEPDFEALVAGAGDDEIGDYEAGDHSEQQADPEDATYDEPAEELKASPGAAETTEPWLPPPAAADAPFLLPPAAGIGGAAGSPTLPPLAGAAEEQSAGPAGVPSGK